MEVILLNVVAGIATLLIGAVRSTNVVQKILHELLPRIFKKKQEAKKSYGERLAVLSDNLQRSSQQVDDILAELASVAKEREQGILTLEKEMEALQLHEKDMRQRIESLQNVPLPAVEHFAKMMNSTEKRKARRDYLLFGAGVVVSTVIAIGLKLLGFG
jgi:septal ring factor EnvC (AmiA/AmiB activator)